MAHVKPMTIHCSTLFSWAARRFQEMREMHSSEFPRIRGLSWGPYDK